MTKGKKRDKLNGFLAVLLCLPLAIIAFLLIKHYTQSITLDDISKITVSAPDKSEITFDSSEDVGFYVDLLTGSLSVETAVRDISNEEPVYIICSDGDENLEYKFYPSLDLSGCMLESPEGDLYVPETDTVKALLLRAEFDYLYSDYFLPTLTVVSGESQFVVNPVESDWSYYKADGEVYKYTPPVLADGSESFMILKGLENTLKFTPDEEVRPFELSDVKYITESGNEYNIRDISELNLSVDTVINVSFTAKWSSMNGAKAFGEAKYSFKLRYDIPAVVEIPSGEYTVGDVIKISATHLNEEEAIELVTMLKVNGIGFDVIGDGNGIALVPVGLDNVAGKYPLEIKTPVGTTSGTIEVSALDGGDFVSVTAIESDQYNSMLSLERLEEFESELAKLTESRPENNYFVYGEEAMYSPVGSKAPTYGFGQQVNLKTYANNDAGSRVCKGVVYELEAGTQVYSAQAGEIVFSGTLAPTGNTVVIYHGYGIYTYYYHLESIGEEIVEGAAVNGKQVIGKAGMTGFTNGKTVLHYAMSIDGVFVDPESIN